MGNLKDNIDHYMELKGIKKYSHLLLAIAKESGLSGQEVYTFAEKEKSNFSKMLKGKRPLKYDFIIPLEKIFGVSLARLLDEEAYKALDGENYSYWASKDGWFEQRCNFAIDQAYEFYYANWR